MKNKDKTRFAAAGRKLRDLERAYDAALRAQNDAIEALDRVSEDPARYAAAAAERCPTCLANAWAKPASNLMCGDCEESMGEAELGDEEA